MCAATATPWGFPGQYYDEETGLYYNRNRYYDPETGRYISADPIGLVSGFNAFAYAENRPTRFVDPLGLMAKAVIEDIPDSPGDSDEYKKKKDKGYKGESSAQNDGPSREKKTEPTDPAVQEAVDNAKKKFKPNKEDKSNKEVLPSTAGKCAEIDALSKQAKDIRAEMSKKDPNWHKLSPGEQNAKIRNKMREQFQNGAKIKAFDKDGKGIPPCKFCAQVMRELGIHPDNINADPNSDKTGKKDKKAKGGVFVTDEDGKDQKWKGKKVHGAGSPSTDKSETAVVPRTDETGKQKKEYNPKAKTDDKKEGVYYPPEDPPAGGYPPEGPKGKYPPPQK